MRCAQTEQARQHSSTLRLIAGQYSDWCKRSYDCLVAKWPDVVLLCASLKNSTVSSVGRLTGASPSHLPWLVPTGPVSRWHAASWHEVSIWSCCQMRDHMQLCLRLAKTPRPDYSSACHGNKNGGSAAAPVCSSLLLFFNRGNKLLQQFLSVFFLHTVNVQWHVRHCRTCPELCQYPCPTIRFPAFSATQTSSLKLS